MTLSSFLRDVFDRMEGKPLPFGIYRVKTGKMQEGLPDVKLIRLGHRSRTKKNCQ